MMAVPIRSGRATPRLVALAVLACALLLRVLVPQGWMPVETGQGWRLTPCSGSGPMAMGDPAGAALAMPGMRSMAGGKDHGMPDHGMPDHGGDHGCPYASLATALEEPVLPTLAVPIPMQSILPIAAAWMVAIGRGLAAPPPPATGPPSV